MFDQVVFELRHGFHKSAVLFLRTEIKNRLDHGTVVPAAVKQHDLTATRKLLDITLKVPLALLHVGGFSQRHHAIVFFIHITGDTTDTTTLTCRVPTFDQDDHLLLLALQVFLQLNQFRLIRPQKYVVKITGITFIYQLPEFFVTLFEFF